MKALREQLEENLSQLADFVRQPLSRGKCGEIVAFITFDVHSRDIFSELAQGEGMSPGDFEWIKRLRHFRDVDSTT
jgi:hypothetical protein